LIFNNAHLQPVNMDFEKQDDIYNDVESTDSETAGFIGSVKVMREPHRRWRLSFRLLRIGLEVCLTAVLLGLFVSGSIHLSHGAPTLRTFGPTLPRKEVIMGNAAGFGPPIEYNNIEMLSNRTEMARIHRNWQQLFPSELNDILGGVHRLI
jgi:hypothetical protein